MVRPARLAKVISDLLDSSLQSLPAHFDVHNASNRLERADLSMGGNILRAAQQRESEETLIHRAERVLDEELDWF